MSNFKTHLEKRLKDKDFAKAWKETEQDYEQEKLKLSDGNIKDIQLLNTEDNLN